MGIVLGLSQHWSIMFWPIPSFGASGPRNGPKLKMLVGVLDIPEWLVEHTFGFILIAAQVAHVTHVYFNYFTSSYPMTFIRFVTGKSSGILSDISSGKCPSGISIWHIHPAFYLAYLLAYLSGKSSGILSGKLFWHYLSGISIWQIYLTFYLAYILALYLAYLMAFYLAYLSGILSCISSGILSDISIWHIYLAYLSGRWGPAVHTELGRSQVEVQQCTFWAGKVPGGGPAVHTELGRSQVEVQRCTLSWAGPRLRSSSAHWAGQVPGWGPAVHTEVGRSQVEVKRCPLSWEGPRLRSSGAHWARYVGEELGQELARQQWTWKWRQRWWRRRRRRRRRRRTTLTKSNNPHLAGGEKELVFWFWMMFCISNNQIIIIAADMHLEHTLEKHLKKLRSGDVLSMDFKKSS